MSNHNHPGLLPSAISGAGILAVCITINRALDMLSQLSWASVFAGVLWTLGTITALFLLLLYGIDRKNRYRQTGILPWPFRVIVFTVKAAAKGLLLPFYALRAVSLSFSAAFYSLAKAGVRVLPKVSAALGAMAKAGWKVLHKGLPQNGTDEEPTNPET